MARGQYEQVWLYYYNYMWRNAFIIMKYNSILLRIGDPKLYPRRV